MGDQIASWAMRRRGHPTNVFEHRAGQDRTIEVFLSHEDYADLVAGGTVVLDESRAAFDHREIVTGDGPSQRPVVRVVIAPRDI
jgi:hypothetical protein